jgi:hypothetical protein
MPSNIFNTQRRATRPPPYCKKGPEDLPPIAPPTGPLLCQAYATWLDHDPLAYNDVAMYTEMLRVGSTWLWHGEKRIRTFWFAIQLERIADPNPWLCTLKIYGDPLYAGELSFPLFDMAPDELFDTGHLTLVTGPLYDKITARVTS